MSPVPSRLAPAVIAWQRSHGRHDLPWQGTRDPYRIWVSEIMLQQTQVSAVIPYYLRFMEALPDVQALAAADVDQVLRLWSGLGYYGRARNLHRCARTLVEAHGGSFPRSAQALATLPGIGRSTAAAIAAFAFGERVAILDGNVKRVFARLFAVDGFTGASAVERRLWALAEQALPEDGIEPYTQGLMDLGATVCTRSAPACARCPLAVDCAALAQGRVAELPQARPARKLEERAVTMLLVERSGEVLLERRPPSGVWGGLWSLPELPAASLKPESVDSESAMVAAEVARRLGMRVLAAEPLEGFVHTFTHFRLRISPWRIDVSPAAARAAEPGVIWMPLEEAIGAALPQPIRRLLRARLAGAQST